MQLLTTGAAQNEAMLKGFNTISDIQLYWKICEDTYLRSSQRGEYKALIGPLTKLYSFIIEYQARVICHLSSAQLSRAWQKVAGWNDWNGKAGDIDDSSKRCSNNIPALQQTAVQKQRDRLLSVTQQYLQVAETQRDLASEHLQVTKQVLQFLEHMKGHQPFSVTKNNTLHMAPPRNKDMVNREDIFSQLTKKLPASAKHQSAALCGLGGSGYVSSRCHAIYIYIN